MKTALAGHYDIVKPLGGGSFGQTYLAKDYHLPGCPMCVVKQLKPKQCDPQTLIIAKRLFDQEAEILYRLGNHDRIPRLLAHFEQDGEFYLVQEFIEGRSLEQELTSGQALSQGDVISLLQDILQVLAFVHAQHVIHRDIKPANLVRRTTDNKIVLIDFGAVKEVRNLSCIENGRAARTVAIGSPGYMPFEQQIGDPHFSSDIYAVGMTAMQALTGLHPDQLPKDLKTGEYRCSLLSNDISISSGLAEILDQMVRHDRFQRYQNATEALQAVEELLHTTEAPTELLHTTEASRTVAEPSCRQSVSKHNSPECTDEGKGQVPLDSPFYIERSSIESRCYQEITKRAALIRIKAPLDMGKTSLLARILNYAEQQGYRTVSLSFDLFDEKARSDLREFLRRFCALVSRDLGISPRKIDEYWDDEFFGPNDNCTEFFEQCLLKEFDCPLVLSLDEVDQIFPDHRVAKEFLKLIRSWHEKAKIASIWAKLRLILAYSTEVYVVMDTNSSPFNVGLEVDLPEFTSEQVAGLASRYGLNWESTQVDRLMSMIGGHPYLVRTALSQVACNNVALERLLETAPTEAGIYGDHLRRHLRSLQKHPELADAMRSVVTVNQPVSLHSELEFKLHRMGLVTLIGNEVIPRSELYRQYFRSRLQS